MYNSRVSFEDGLCRSRSPIFYLYCPKISLEIHYPCFHNLEVLKKFALPGFHVDDSEVTLNVCVGKQFTGGELFFRGVRCEKHVNTGTQSEVYEPIFQIYFI